MAIGIVELNGMVGRTQDYQQLQHHENERGPIFQPPQQEQVASKRKSTWCTKKKMPGPIRIPMSGNVTAAMAATADATAKRNSRRTG